MGVENEEDESILLVSFLGIPKAIHSKSIAGGGPKG